MKSGVYQIINETNGKSYIGSAVNIQKRLQRHFWELRIGKHNNQYLQRSYKKKAVFAVKLLEYCVRQELIVREQFWMDELKPEYNILKKAYSALGYKFTDEQRRRVSEGTKGNKNGYIDGRQARKEAARLKRGTVEHSMMVSARMKGNKHAAGHVLTQEARDKISKSNKGQKRTEKFCENNSTMRQGILNPAAKLNEQQVRVIRANFKLGEPVRGKDLAKFYNVTPALISAIKNNKIWTEV